MVHGSQNQSVSTRITWVTPGWATAWACSPRATRPSKDTSGRRPTTTSTVRPAAPKAAPTPTARLPSQVPGRACPSPARSRK